MTAEPKWRTSSYTKSDSCVEVADNDSSVVLVRDSKDRDRGCLTFLPAPWASFVEYAKGHKV
ncbi:DUF397 domain-containing protein [Streptomyces sp. RTd22]|uniref:DUF397 domain-containing protein n=1 Tax=Streptomyces sp. RTd22 TaxID=1841249 RepID=UPI000B267005|nr:DUF397 domain-containing protein [Streptomyces sp. RTd22]